MTEKWGGGSWEKAELGVKTLKAPNVSRLTPKLSSHRTPPCFATALGPKYGTAALPAQSAANSPKSQGVSVLFWLVGFPKIMFSCPSFPLSLPRSDRCVRTPPAPQGPMWGGGSAGSVGSVGVTAGTYLCFTFWGGHRAGKLQIWGKKRKNENSSFSRRVRPGCTPTPPPPSPRPQ